MQRIAAPPAPEASMPDVGELPPSGGGMATVVIGTDVPARVEHVTHRVVRVRREQQPESAWGGEGLLCAETPCTVTLPYGDHELVFTGTHDEERVSKALLSVRREMVVLNHTLGRVHRPAGQSLAWGLALTGAVVIGLVIGVAEVQTNEAPRPRETSILPAAAGVGLGTMLLGGIVGMASPGTRQEGASTQWSPRGPVAGAGLGFRF